MRSRTVREGSVGFLILLGLGLFGGLVLWLRGVNLSNRSYRFVVEFASVQGLQVGTPVRYRGVAVGKITAIKPGPNGVDVLLEIAPADLIIPRDSVIEASKSGLIGEASIEIKPRSLLPQSALAANPLARDCPDLIVCDNVRLQGEAGVTLDELIRSSVQFANLYSDPKFFANIQALTENTAEASKSAIQLTRDLSSLSQSVKSDLTSLRQSIQGELGSLNQSVTTQLGAITGDINRLATTTDTSAKALTEAAVTSANSVAQAANQISLTAGQVNSLIATNRTTLVATLGTMNQTAEDLQVAVRNLSPAINRLQQGQLITNLEVLSANAAQASANLRDLSSAVNSPTNLLVLQQTLDSARATFQNVQKITSDLDELTGDPNFRTNIRRLVNGLGGLVGSTQQLQEQTQLAQTLAPLSQTTAERTPVSSEFPSLNKQSKIMAFPAQTARVSEEKSQRLKQ